MLPRWTIKQIVVNSLPSGVAVHALGGVNLSDLVEVKDQRDVSDVKLCEQAGLCVGQACDEFLKLF